METDVVNVSQVEPSSGLPPSVSAPPSSPPGPMPHPGGCPTCAGGMAGVASYVYALGRVELRVPSPSVEKEFVQTTGRTATAGKTDREALHAVLSKRENRYLARQVCWVLTVQGMETYILSPRDPADLDLLIEAIRPTPSPLDIDAVVGLRGPIAPPELCNGLMIPIVAFDQIYSFDRDTLIKAIPKPKEMTAEKFGSAAGELFDRIIQMTDNAGVTDEHRALNYLAMRYKDIYLTAVDAFARDCSLTAVETRPSRLSGTRKIIDVIFAYTNRKTDFTEKFFARTDVTEEFPFLVTKMSPYYDR